MAVWACVNGFEFNIGIAAFATSGRIVIKTAARMILKIKAQVAPRVFVSHSINVAPLFKDFKGSNKNVPVGKNRNQV